MVPERHPRETGRSRRKGSNGRNTWRSVRLLNGAVQCGSARSGWCPRGSNASSDQG